MLSCVLRINSGVSDNGRGLATGREADYRTHPAYGCDYGGSRNFDTPQGIVAEDDGGFLEYPYRYRYRYR